MHIVIPFCCSLLFHTMSSSNHVELISLYPWITIDFLQNVLQKATKSNSKLQGFLLKNAVAKGENYASQMIRCTLRFKEDSQHSEQTLDIIIKAMISDEFVKNVVGEVFSNEVKVFQTILPVVETILQREFDQHQISARLF